MSEEEKLEKGLLYDANNDNSIREKIVNAQRICFKYNNIEPSDVKKREDYRGINKRYWRKLCDRTAIFLRLWI